MILFEITEDENHDEYRQLEYSNLIRQQSFLDQLYNLLFVWIEDFCLKK